MVAVISAMSSLRTLSLEFQSPRSRPDQELPPPKQSILPVLYTIYFHGVTEYSEDFVNRIDTPQLNTFNITLHNQINFDCSRLAQFINRTPRLMALDEVHVQLTSIRLRYRNSLPGYYKLQINIPFRELHWQLSSIEQVSNSPLLPLPSAQNLYIIRDDVQPVWKNNAVENTLWLQLLLPYSAVKNLYLSKEFVPSIAAALRELVGARIMDVLPSLQNIFVEVARPLGNFREIFERFVTAQHISGRPVAILSRSKIPNWGLKVPHTRRWNRT
jgi:hypothetical protein